ncbi:flavodoxin family protein [candidate division WOR-3 bacterium]|nr:flavodoxin family protein [candidate division WOR-3 bacterium]
MKLFAVNSSPRRDRGGTGLLLASLLAGARKAGAEVDLVHLHGLDIRPCQACFKCWLANPGRCVQEDDMAGLLPRLAAAEVVVFATPVFVDGMNGPMKTFLDRTIPLLEPWFEEHEGHCRHPRREWLKTRRIALVAVSGFTELDNFEPLVAHIRATTRNMGCKFAGALLRPYASSLPDLARHGVPVGEVFDAAQEAGRLLAERGSIAQPVLERVSRELVPRSLYIKLVNGSFEGALGRHRG